MADSFLDKLVAARESLGRQSAVINVGGEDITVYWEPITVADTKAVEKLEPQTEFDHNLFMIVRKLTDENGDPLFDRSKMVTAKKTLEDKVQMSVLANINFAMRQDIPASVAEATEELEKNPD